VPHSDWCAVMSPGTAYAESQMPISGMKMPNMGMSRLGRPRSAVTAEGVGIPPAWLHYCTDSYGLYSDEPGVRTESTGYRLGSQRS
jgi:hypothetical protein